MIGPPLRKITLNESILQSVKLKGMLKTHYHYIVIKGVEPIDTGNMSLLDRKNGYAKFKLAQN